mgnify:CR=1 FL=1
MELTKYDSKILSDIKQLLAIQEKLVIVNSQPNIDWVGICKWIENNIMIPLNISTKLEEDMNMINEKSNDTTNNIMKEKELIINENKMEIK